MSMAPRKQIVTLNGPTPKNKAINAIGDTIPPLAIDQPHTTEDTGLSSPQGAAANIQASLPQNKDQFFQLADMKQQMKKQAETDHDWKQAALDPIIPSVNRRR